MAKPKGEMPYTTQLPSGSYRLKRPVPDDLKHVLGDYWVHNFPAGTLEKTIREVATALNDYYDRVIEERRARLGSIKMAGAT